MFIELIRLICKKGKVCNEDCPFYDRSRCECVFNGGPENWPSGSEITKRLEEYING